MSVYRLSPQQAYILGDEAPAASQCVFARPAGDEPELRRRLHALVARHEILRSTFEWPVGARAPVGQTVHDTLAPAISAPAGGPCTRVAADGAAVNGALGPVVRIAIDERWVTLTVAAGCADARSLALLAAELGRPASDTPPPIQHADYAQWRHELRLGEDPDIEAARTFWVQALAGVASGRVLFGRTSAARGRVARGQAPVALDAEVLEALAGVAARAGVAPEIVAHAAWRALLVRLGADPDLLTAHLADGRGAPELADAVGPYAQPVPVRGRVEPAMSFLEQVDRVARAIAEAERWQDFASEGDLSALGQRALAGLTPVPPAVDGVRWLSGGSTGCPLELVWTGGTGACVRYDAEAYPAADAHDIARAFARLLAAAAADPSRPVEALPLLDEARRAHMLCVGLGDEVASPPETVPRRVARQARERPEASAVVGGEESLSYGELDERSARVAARLSAEGARPGGVVGLCLPRSPGMLVALLAILRAGCAYLPLNPSHPAARLAAQRAEAEADLLVTDSTVAGRLGSLGARAVVCLDELDLGAGSPGEAASPVNLAADLDPARLAYVIHTSGSTGRPKGVEITHASLAAYTDAIAHRLAAGPGLHWAVVSDITTDLGNTALFPALATGGCVHLIDPTTAMDGDALAAYMARHQIDILKITPSHLRAVLTGGAGVVPHRWLVVGGEALGWDLVRQVHELRPAARVLNHYGPTETTVGATTFEATAEAELEPPAATVPIGRPLAGVRAYVLDGRSVPVPIGVPGELCIGGRGVARGYAGQPQETAARFVPDPRGGRMYRTGDRVRWNRDGALEFLGRLDDQVKIRGHRVEPGEVQAALLGHPAVAQAAVVARADGEGDTRLLAYCVASPAVAEDELLAFLAERVPDYMLPARCVAVAALPLTAGGKVDRAALPDPDTGRPERAGELVAPRDELEREIAGVWSQLLGVAQVGVTDDFFALGGHSLMAVQAIMRIRRRHPRLPLGALFGAPTVAALAEVVRGAG